MCAIHIIAEKLSNNIYPGHIQYENYSIVLIIFGVFLFLRIMQTIRATAPQTRCKPPAIRSGILPMPASPIGPVIAFIISGPTNCENPKTQAEMPINTAALLPPNLPNIPRIVGMNQPVPHPQKKLPKTTIAKLPAKPTIMNPKATNNQPIPKDICLRVLFFIK